MNRIKNWYSSLPENEKGNLQFVIGYTLLMVAFALGILAIAGKV